MRTMLVYSDDNFCPETTLFFEEDTLITAISGNDGEYRHEYMKCLFTNFGVDVKHIKKLNSAQIKSVEKNASWCLNNEEG